MTEQACMLVGMSIKEGATDRAREEPQRRKIFQKSTGERSCLVVQWLRLWVPSREGLSLIPGQGTRSHMQQTKTQYNQINNLKKKKQRGGTDL